ncbi:phosphotransferase family protein [Streptomyces jeddahensis]|uniref:Phosphotransferase enzyme family protein n=1 Tax=Streptomyces jeddahensis TaxID=1716141 RepID=A0A177HPM5_9ACTN|nr:aminoglycoside phosphotransferase family protein [Streptomyces jeddahensis]OAH12951.1 phosphotransferase enzyme family protein [Streptomyces jeddahensis]
MQSQTKRRLTAGQLDALLRESAGTGCRLEAELTDGWFNAAYRVLLDDGRPAIVKLAPPADVPVLRYERGIMATEAMVYRRAGGDPAGIPMPELLFSGADFLAVSVLDGTPWDKLSDALPGSAHSALRHELGRITAQLHALTPEDGRFGYPAPEAGLSAPDWRGAFTAMVEGILDDAARWESPLGISAADVRALVAEGGYALDEITEPRLVHFDLWPGNVFVDDSGARVTGIIDHERAFWGDPAAELVSLAFGGDTGPDSELVAGYIEAGGRLGSGPAFEHRLALYRLYLGLILVVECAPRGYDAEHLAYCRGALDGWVSDVRKLG